MARLSPHKQYDYVEGDFPAGIKFMGDFGTKQVQQIQAHGGKVMIIPPNYQLSDLQDAREKCK